MKHEIEMKAEHLGVEKSGIELKVVGGGNTIGTLFVSNARLVWYPKNSKKRKASYSWEEFDFLVKKDVK